MNLSERRKGASVKTETEDAPGASSGSELWNVVDLVDELDVDRITVFGSSRSHQDVAIRLPQERDLSSFFFAAIG